MKRSFAPPASLAEADARHAALVGEAQAIDAQLTAYKLDQSAFVPDWRNRAVYAKSKIVEEMRQLNLWRKQQRQQAHALTVGIGAKHSDPRVVMLSRAYRLLRRFAVEFEVTPEEQAEVEAVMAYLQNECVDPEVAAKIETSSKTR